MAWNRAMTACIRCGILAVLLLLLNMVAIAQHLAASGTAPSEEAAALNFRRFRTRWLT